MISTHLKVVTVIDILREVAQAEKLNLGWARGEFEDAVVEFRRFLRTDHDPLEDESWAWFVGDFGLTAALWDEAPMVIVNRPWVARVGLSGLINEVVVDDFEAPRIYVTEDVVERAPLLEGDFDRCWPGPCVLSVLDFTVGLV